MLSRYGFLQSWSQINGWASHKLPDGIKPLRDIKIAVHNPNVKSVTLDGTDVDFEMIDNVCYVLKAEDHAKRKLSFNVES